MNDKLQKIRKILSEYGYPSRAEILSMADTIESQQKEIEVLKKGTFQIMAALIHNEQKQQIQQLQDKLNEAVEVLEFYSSYWNHYVQLEDVGFTSLQRDRGQKARETLSHIQGKETQNNKNGVELKMVKHMKEHLIGKVVSNVQHLYSDDIYGKRQTGIKFSFSDGTNITLSIEHDDEMDDIANLDWHIQGKEDEQ